MRLLRFSAIVMLITITVCYQLALAGTTGKITGEVLEKDTNQPVIGARVTIEGTTMGAMVNPMDGSYIIQNVPPGTYTIVASCIGFNPVTVTNLLVHVDVTTEMNFEMTSQAIQLDSVVVVADVKEIDKYETSGVDRISSREIESLPVTNLQGIVKMQTGIVSHGGALHVRGSRAGELGFVDDGVLIRDNLGGYGQANVGGNESTPISRLSMNLSSSDIEDASIMKGNYSAEYGNVSGGLVTTQRKEGSNRKTEVTMEFLTDDFGFPELNDYSFNNDYFNVSMNGPLPLLSDKIFPALDIKWPGEKMSYYASFNADLKDGYVDYNDYDSPKSKIDYGTEEFLGISFPKRRINKYSGYGKLTWKMDPKSRYKLNLRYSKEWSDGQVFSYSYLYTPQTAAILKSATEVASARFSFNPPFLKSTFGELMYSQVIQTYERRPGGFSPSDFYVPIEGFESYVDANSNGQWDPAEGFEDLNGDGVWGEPYQDLNRNGYWDNDEPYTDLNNNGNWDPEPFNDANNNGTWDPAEIINNDVYYVDVNGNGHYDDDDSTYLDVNNNGNGVYDPELSDIFGEDRAEPYIDGDLSLGEYFYDKNGNGVYDEGVDGWNPIDDRDHNGRYTGPDEPWADGIDFIDYNGNGRYDAPNQRYDYGEEYYDANGNGRWDNTDQFLDYGYDRWTQYHSDYDRTRTLKLDITSQISRHHEIKSGFEFNFHKIVYQDMQYPYIQYDGPDDGGNWENMTRVIGAYDTTGNGLADVFEYQEYSKGVFRDFYTRTPKDGAYYIRDKIEYGELIAEVGFRYEFFIQAREVKDSVTLIREGLDWRQIIDSQDKVAPRVGFSFPISEKAKLFFNYGHFYQRPGYTKYYQRRTQATSAAAVFGNPNLDYEKTITYEVGVQYSIAEGYKLDISGYYKDQYGLLNTVPEGIDPNSPDYQDNVDYARSRGLEFQLEKKYGQFLAGSIKYEYTWAFGKSSSDASDYYIRFAGGEISIKENPLDWDIRHQLTAFLSLNVAKGEHPRFGIFKLPDDWNASVTWLYKSGRPFTPDRAYPGLSLGVNEDPLTNSERMPATSTVDVGIYKNFQLIGLNYTFRVLINNLFDYKNVDDVYDATGLANTSVVSNHQILTGLPLDSDPTYYTSGRQIMFGLGVKF